MVRISNDSDADGHDPRRFVQLVSALLEPLLEQVLSPPPPTHASNGASVAGFGSSIVKPPNEILTAACGRDELLVRLGSLIKNFQAELLTINLSERQPLNLTVEQDPNRLAIFLAKLVMFFNFLDPDGKIKYILALGRVRNPKKSKFVGVAEVTNSLHIGDPMPQDLGPGETETVALRNSVAETEEILGILLRAKKLDVVAVGGLGDDRKPMVEYPFNRKEDSGSPKPPEAFLKELVDRVSGEHQIFEWDVFLTKADQKRGEGDQPVQQPGFCVLLMPSNRLRFPEGFAPLAANKN